MCGLLDDALPILGAVAGGLIGGPWGAAIGGTLGGFGGQYFQTHDFGTSLFGGAMGGIGGYFGGANLADNLFGGATGGLGSLAGTAGANAADTLGGLESATGGAGLFGPMAGTGQAIGNAASALGGGGLGTAGADALSGISQAGLGYMGGLGGSLGGTGLGTGTLGGEVADFNGVMNGIPSATGGPTASAGATGMPSASPSPIGAMNTNPTANAIPGQAGALGGGGQATGMGAQTAPTVSGEAAQAAPMDQNAAAAGAISNPGTEAGGGNLSTMYGPTSSSATLPTQSPMGQSVGATGGPFNQVQAGALGEAPKTGMDLDSLSGLFGGQTSGASPLMRLGNSLYTGYQNYEQGQRQRDYMNQIQNMFSPNSPYAQQMQQTLARQDAAAGRNSQYGNRSVQLAAALAQAQAQALGGSNYYRAATAPSGLAGMFNPFMANFGSPQGMQALGQLGSAAFNGLQSLF